VGISDCKTTWMQDLGRVMINGSCVLMKNTVDSHRLVEVLSVGASIGNDRGAMLMTLLEVR